ncbi:SUKH-3 domain-containing protein [Chitinimonas sp. JJ19]|uniref:SUKH-3 domain-containing protein n=1 Tax=Chitinimonas sp. JJ19 TaxID=3109352 RepID=UPI001A4DB240|nr:SUKH-3 domain-containing protein [Chitinimonas sp.]
MLQIPTSIVPLFLRAGWQPPAQPRETPSAESAEAYAATVIAEFGGLQVGATGAGRDLAASDVSFYCEPQQDVASLVEQWSSQVGNLAAVASAHHDHMVVFVDANGRFYAFTDPDDRLYLIGRSLGEAMERLLLGFGYGAPIPRGA